MKNKNHNHFIACVYQTCNDPKWENPLQSPYFDGTQAQAIKYFRALPLLKKYRSREGYRILISSNSLELDYNC